MIKCAVHKLSPIELVCPHIKENLLIGKTIKLKEVEQIVYGEGLFINHLLFCRKCSDNYNFPSSKKIITDEDEGNYEEALSSIVPICHKCYSHLIT